MKKRVVSLAADLYESAQTLNAPTCDLRTTFNNNTTTAREADAVEPLINLEGTLTVDHGWHEDSVEFSFLDAESMFKEETCLWAVHESAVKLQCS